VACLRVINRPGTSRDAGRGLNVKVGAVQASACVTALIALGAGASMAWVQSSTPSSRSGAAPTVPPKVATQPPPAVPPAPPTQTIIQDAGISFPLGDTYATGFLDDIAVDCPGGYSVSMREFLHLQMAEAKAAGMTQAYELSADTTTPKPVVRVSATMRMASGSPVPGYPENVTFSYVVDWPYARLYEVSPRTPASDPVSSLNLHHEAACNVTLAKRLMDERRAERKGAAQADAAP
jgi:hypothetical protein